MRDCCKATKKNKNCRRRSDKKIFSLPRRFTKKRCMKGVKGFTMRSSCAPYKDCMRGGSKKNRKRKSTTRKKAIAILGKNKNKVRGTVKFSQKNNSSPVLVRYHIRGLTNGKHGFHIHQLGNTGNNCLNAKGHFNPNKKEHGRRKSHHRHAGDLGNIISKRKLSKGQFYDKHISLCNNKNNIIGRTVVVHEKEDDLGMGHDKESKVTGNAGPRVACGVIGIN